MTRKIFLEGELGAKFGSVFEFSGPTVSDAIKCVAANRPDFRKYLIEAHEQDIGFVVVNGRIPMANRQAGEAQKEDHCWQHH